MRLFYQIEQSCRFLMWFFFIITEIYLSSVKCVLPPGWVIFLDSSILWKETKHKGSISCLQPILCKLALSQVSSQRWAACLCPTLRWEQENELTWTYFGWFAAWKLISIGLKWMYSLNTWTQKSLNENTLWRFKDRTLRNNKIIITSENLKRHIEQSTCGWKWTQLWMWLLEYTSERFF